MLNFKKKEQLNENEKRDLHMLHYDGYKRFTVEFPTSRFVIDSPRQKECEEFEEALREIHDHYTASIKAYPSLESCLMIDDMTLQYQIYDNLSQEYIEMPLADINKINLILKILNSHVDRC